MCNSGSWRIKPIMVIMYQMYLTYRWDFAGTDHYWLLARTGNNCSHQFQMIRQQVPHCNNLLASSLSCSPSHRHSLSLWNNNLPHPANLHDKKQAIMSILVWRHFLFCTSMLACLTFLVRCYCGRVTSHLEWWYCWTKRLYISMSV